MITVIADDFTGAAELGGLGLRYGMSVEIEIEVTDDCKVDLLIIATDTRSLSSKEAYDEMLKISMALEKINTSLIYKKTDSVMRGHVLNELEAVLKASSKNKILLVPANPSFGRTISGGQYYIHNIPLHKTGFSEDPEFAMSSSDVLELLGESGGLKTLVRKNNQDIPNGSLVIGDAESDQDLKKWAKKVDVDLLPAGAAGFFSAILEENGSRPVQKDGHDKLQLGNRKLYVCGSSFSSSRNAIELAKKNGQIVCEIPSKLFHNVGSERSNILKWAEDIVSGYNLRNSVIIAINKPIVSKSGFAKRLRDLTADVVEKVMKQVTINELFIEGGATTSAIVRKVNFKKFFPEQEVAPGVIRMRIEEKPDMHLTLKPGSYVWPSSIWQIS